jgi:hypothetical protein
VLRPPVSLLWTMSMNWGPVQPAFFGTRVQNRIENASPAKKVDAARAVWPVRKPRMADAVQQNMITTIKAMSRMRRRLGVSTA